MKSVGKGIRMDYGTSLLRKRIRMGLGLATFGTMIVADILFFVGLSNPLVTPWITISIFAFGFVGLATLLEYLFVHAQRAIVNRRGLTWLIRPAMLAFVLAACAYLLLVSGYLLGIFSAFSHPLVMPVLTAAFILMACVAAYLILSFCQWAYRKLVAEG
ncbi:hypothetical protein KSX_45830 [Ktedonospora formicarum]|uniref:Uncharacterized protein n=2 Tax=Ktedonospora formicarum TaxID=2778364 RepID=A0A8J3MSS3_9CHLR|nr:hypothetical protein KSX_45830 [Ktedonospora formicarum]